MDSRTQLLKSEIAYLKGKVEAYENFLRMKGFLEQKECENFGEGLEDASRD